ncbi:hypothetical protein I8751_01320 [Nostocaceae cyanobacterium CENA357]|uniref:Uncharacterized protein n=1 Tax=Atlanticothrix silvestris CENA357 TaxID=1725252 RepID=A0A8J7H5S3_9CYAN|nr:hypothetical protein [Atlanticothrix silvestris CENA357]
MMWEKLSLAAILTLSLSLFTQMSWPSSSQRTKNINLPDQGIFALTQLYK